MAESRDPESKRRDREADALRAPCETLDPSVPCRCREAMMRAYREMMANGASDSDAHVVAARIYCYHHPDVPVSQANALVLRLTAQGQLH